jgi:hypothetical protein
MVKMIEEYESRRGVTHKYRPDFKEPSWEWDETTPSQYYATLDSAKTDMYRHPGIEGRFKNFRIYERTADCWVLVGEFDFEQPERSN